MEILAKKIEIDDEIIATQSLQQHTRWVIDEAMKLIDNTSIKKVSNKCGFEEDLIRDLIFFCAYFHDIGKATKEFQSTIKDGVQSYHSLYSASVLVGIDEFEFVENDRYINLLFVIVLTHHTLLPYRVKNAKFEFLDKAKEFFLDYRTSYEYYLNKKCSYDFRFDVDKEIKSELIAVEEDLQYIKSNHKLRVIYTYVSGILNLADWLASAKFNKTMTPITFNTKPTKKEFLKSLPFDKLREFQEELSEKKESVLVEIPTGEGKTEGSLLWAINNLIDTNTKIIYTLPTQTTSNKLYERIQTFFDKNECGLIHSSAKVILEKKYEEENGKVDKVFKSDFLLSKSFNKPVTVSTIDALLKYFINIGRFNIATKNFFNSVIIIDEIHAYDMKLMGFLKRFFELCDEFDVKVCLMSASIPNRIKELLGVQRYPLISQQELFEKKANKIIKVDSFLNNDLNLILDKFQSGKNVLVIRNTVKNATQTFKELQNSGIESKDIILYHSTFKKIDRTKKEELIFKKLKEKRAFILVATQIVEVSLDIDFDVMFTDNAPIDSLIQRFGRVNRKKSLEKKGEIFIYKVEKSLPYRDAILDITFETIQDGYFELGEYVKWLNIVYDRLFDEDITIQNEISRLFDNGYAKYDVTIKKLDGIKKSPDNYDLRDIDDIKNDYLLYDDYINDRIDYEYTITLPYYLEKDYKHEVPQNRKDIFYPVLNLSYTFEEGVIEKENSILL
jgi:CRISPR-associated endonuclease/helicase Cas3